MLLFINCLERFVFLSTCKYCFKVSFALRSQCRCFYEFLTDNAKFFKKIKKFSPCSKSFNENWTFGLLLIKTSGKIQIISNLTKDAHQYQKTVEKFLFFKALL